MIYTHNTHSRVGFVLFGMLAVGALCAVATSASAQSTMPYQEDFETHANGAVVNWDGWQPSDNSVVVQQSVVYDQGAQAGDTNAAYIPSESALTNNFGGVTVQRVWTEMYVQPTLESAYSTSAPSVDASSTAFFYFNSNGFAKVWDADHWEVLTTTAAGASASSYTGGWVRVTVYQNYNSDAWALFTNKVLLAENIGFNSAASKYYHFALRNGTYLDMAYVDTYFPTNASNDAHSNFDVDTDGDGSGDIWELHYFTSASTYGAGTDVDNDGLRNEEEYRRMTDPTSASSVSWIVPYFQTFESGYGAISGTWKGVGVSGNATIQTSEALEGSKALCVSTGSVSFSVTSVDTANDTNIWVQTYAKAAPYYDGGGPPTVGADTAAAFYIQRGTGKLLMRSGSSWVYSDHIVSVDTNAWLGFSVHLDYNADKWALYVSTNGFYGETMVRVTTNLLDFNTGCTQVCFTAASIETELPTYVDALAVSEGYDPVSTLHTNVVAQERLANQSVLTSLPPYQYEGANRRLDGLLGDHLQRGRLLTRAADQTEADRVKIYSSGIWHVFHLTELSGWSGTGIGLYQATNSVAFDREPGSDFAVFYPYTNLDESVYATELVGTDDPSSGWNQLSWPATYPARDFNGPTPDTGLPPNDYPEIWLYRNSHYVRLFWSSSRNGWVDSSIYPPGLATIHLQPGEGFWYRRRVGGTIMWSPVR